MDQSDTWYVRRHGKVQGPYTLDQLRQLNDARQLDRFCEVSRDRIDWAPVEMLSEVVGVDEVQIGDSGSGGAPEPGGEDEWLYVKGGRQLGPVSLATLKLMASTGELEPHDLVWAPGRADWETASKLGVVSFPKRQWSNLFGKRTKLIFVFTILSFVFAIGLFIFFDRRRAEHDRIHAINELDRGHKLFTKSLQDLRDSYLANIEAQNAEMRKAFDLADTWKKHAKEQEELRIRIQLKQIEIAEADRRGRELAAAYRENAEQISLQRSEQEARHRESEYTARRRARAAEEAAREVKELNDKFK